jgi:hypothetical protein
MGQISYLLKLFNLFLTYLSFSIFYYFICSYFYNLGSDTLFAFDMWNIGLLFVDYFIMYIFFFFCCYYCSLFFFYLYSPITEKFRIFFFYCFYGGSTMKYFLYWNISSNNFITYLCCLTIYYHHLI